MREEILSLTDRELDRRVAKLMGRVNADGYWITDSAIKPYSSDIAAAFEAEEKIKELGKEEPYVFALLGLLGFPEDVDCVETFAIIHATPKQRCQAALLAMEVEE